MSSHDVLAMSETCEACSLNVMEDFVDHSMVVSSSMVNNAVKSMNQMHVCNFSVFTSHIHHRTNVRTKHFLDLD